MPKRVTLRLGDYGFTDAQAGFLDDLGVSEDDDCLLSMVKCLVCTLCSHGCANIQQMKGAVETAKKLVLMPVYPDELLNPLLGASMLWDTEGGRDAALKAGFEPGSLDMIRLKSAIEGLNNRTATRKSVSFAVDARTSAATDTVVYTGARKSASLTMQLATVFKEEIDAGHNISQMVSHMGKAEFDKRLKSGFERYVGKSQGPWQVGKQSYHSFEAAYQALRGVLGQKISNIKKAKGSKRGRNGDDARPQKRVGTVAAAEATSPAKVEEQQPAAGETHPLPTTAAGPLELVTAAQQQQQGQEERACSHVRELVSTDAKKGFLLCGVFGKNENIDVVAIGVPLSTMHERMLHTDLISMAVVKVVGSVAAQTTVGVGGKQVKFARAQTMTSWTLSGVYTSWEGKTAASFGCTEKQLENAAKQ